MSVKLLPGRSYQLSFNADPPARTGVARMTDLARGADLAAVVRQGKGGQAPGSLGVPPSGTSDPAIDRL